MPAGIGRRADAPANTSNELHRRRHIADLRWVEDCAQVGVHVFRKRAPCDLSFTDVSRPGTFKQSMRQCAA